MTYELNPVPSRFQPPAHQPCRGLRVTTTLPDIHLSLSEWHLYHRHRGRVIADPARRGWWDNFRMS